MTVRMSGIDYHRFMTDDTYWPERSHWDDTDIKEEGPYVTVDYSQLPTAVTITGGDVYDKNGKRHASAEEFAQGWLNMRNNVTLVLDVPREHAEAVKTSIAAIFTNLGLASPFIEN